ncbi:hypothetical protein [Celeribacter sp.]|uniref:hypothetical protein n=1 Tax=Celeribacter sp. TaxID=1890673 RepID=UPI003A94E171
MQFYKTQICAAWQHLNQCKYRNLFWKPKLEAERELSKSKPASYLFTTRTVAVSDHILYLIKFVPEQLGASSRHSLRPARTAADSGHSMNLSRTAAMRRWRPLQSRGQRAALMGRTAQSGHSCENRLTVEANSRRTRLAQLQHQRHSEVRAETRHSLKSLGLRPGILLNLIRKPNSLVHNRLSLVPKLPSKASTNPRISQKPVSLIAPQSKT